MSDLISRQAAIDAADRTDYLGLAVEDVKKVTDEVVKELKKLPSARQEQRWIPVSERLPKEKGLYLTTTMHGDVYCDYWNGLNFDRTEYVTAWMPLPEPARLERD